MVLGGLMALKVFLFVLGLLIPLLTTIFTAIGKGTATFIKKFHYIGTVAILMFVFWVFGSGFASSDGKTNIVVTIFALIASILFVIFLFKYQPVLRAAASFNGVFILGLIVVLAGFRPAGSMIMDTLVPAGVTLLIIFAGIFSSKNIVDKANEYVRRSFNGVPCMALALLPGGFFTNLIAALFYVADTAFLLFVGEKFLFYERLGGQRLTVINLAVCSLVFIVSFILLYVVNNYEEEYQDSIRKIQKEGEGASSRTEYERDMYKEAYYYEKEKNAQRESEESYGPWGGQSSYQSSSSGYEHTEDAHDNNDEQTGTAEQQSNTMDFFAGCSTTEALTAAYRKLCLVYHPDNASGDAEMFKLIDQQYREKLEALKAAQNETQNTTGTNE